MEAVEKEEDLMN